jgi:hypothetical protein
MLVLTILFTLSAAGGFFTFVQHATVDVLDGHLYLALEIVLLVMLLYFLWRVFGALSRTLEQHADLSGAMLMGDFATFRTALEKIAFLSGNVRNVKGWRHHSVAHRGGFLESVRNDPAIGEAFLRKLSRIRTILFVLFGISVVAFAYHVAGDLTQDAESRLWREAGYYYTAGQPDEIGKVIDRTALEVSPGKAAVFSAAYARRYHLEGDRPQAERFLQKAEELQSGLKIIKKIRREIECRP